MEEDRGFPDDPTLPIVETDGTETYLLVSEGEDFFLPRIATVLGFQQGRSRSHQPPAFGIAGKGHVGENGIGFERENFPGVVF
jgi:hypothetical protein